MLPADVRERFEALLPRFIALNAKPDPPFSYMDWSDKKIPSKHDPGWVAYKFTIKTSPPPPRINLFDYPEGLSARRMQCFEKAIQRGFPCVCGNHTREDSVSWCELHVDEGKECVCGEHINPRKIR